MDKNKSLGESYIFENCVVEVRSLFALESYLETLHVHPLLQFPLPGTYILQISAGVHRTVSAFYVDTLRCCTSSPSHWANSVWPGASTSLIHTGQQKPFQPVWSLSQCREQTAPELVFLRTVALFQNSSWGFGAFLFLWYFFAATCGYASDQEGISMFPKSQNLRRELTERNCMMWSPFRVRPHRELITKSPHSTFEEVLEFRVVAPHFPPSLKETEFKYCYFATSLPRLGIVRSDFLLMWWMWDSSC